jgi:putative membrane protein
MVQESKGMAQVARSLLGGTLMGLANLVPGISGGTMLLASGVYPAFIGAIAEVTTFKFRFRSLLVLACVTGSAGLAILLLAGLVKSLVVDHRWVMYSLFIGLTLGGLPVVWRMIGRPGKAVWVGAVAGALGMAVLAWLQIFKTGGGAVGGSGPITLFVAGIAGASAMILPGVSGGYLLLVLGQYIPILSAIERFKDALKAAQWAEAFDVGLQVGLPVGIGVIAGMVGVSHLLKLLLKRYRNATLGVLLGLLVGAVAGLWPFQEGLPPAVGAVYHGVVMTEEQIDALDPEDYPIHFFRPTVGQGVGAFLVLLAGFAVTMGVARIGGDESEGDLGGSEADPNRNQNGDPL